MNGWIKANYCDTIELGWVKIDVHAFVSPMVSRHNEKRSWRSQEEQSNTFLNIYFPTFGDPPLPPLEEKNPDNRPRPPPPPFCITFCSWHFCIDHCVSCMDDAWIRANYCDTVELGRVKILLVFLHDHNVQSSWGSLPWWILYMSSSILWTLVVGLQFWQVFQTSLTLIRLKCYLLDAKLLPI